MSINEPKITVVIPNHNHEMWIKDCLDSVVNDEYSNKQIVVVDDGSSDGSGNKIFNLIKSRKEFVSNSIPYIEGTYLDSGIKIRFVAIEKTVGPSAARNIGMKVFYEDTDLFSFIDSDDMHVFGKLKETTQKMLNNYGYVGVVYCDYINFYTENKKIHEQYKEPFCKERLLSECIIPCHSLVAKYAIDQVGFFDEQMRVAEDYDLWIRISKKFVCYHIPKSLAVVRRGPHNSDYVVNKNIWAKNWQRIREKITNAK
jgi:glycosyltransferase involved in cell wall biosynthesis